MSAWLSMQRFLGTLLAAVLVGAMLAGPANAAPAFARGAAPAAGHTDIVNSPADISDANPGDGVCETAPGNQICTLRAAIQEVDAGAGGDIIQLQPGTTYLLS